MANKTIDAAMFCPFYLSEAAMSITCEGIIGNSTVNRFASAAEKIYHEQNFCMDMTCRGCGVYTALLQEHLPAPKKKPAALRH
ncbi:MAG: hypothetical protein IKL24_06780 [Clostridia bacterium]|nr:hypothetical protein [Clostridia bacterium]